LLLLPNRKIDGWNPGDVVPGVLQLASPELAQIFVQFQLHAPVGSNGSAT
jgi:hypothetical protein